MIDDSESDRYLARRTLNRAGVTRRVLEFPDALTALELLTNREKFERECGPCPPRAVVLLDINMPRMSGFDFLEAIERRIDSGDLEESTLSVIMYSTSDLQADVDRALGHRLVADYMVKPITIQDAARIASAAQSTNTEV